LRGALFAKKIFTYKQKSSGQTYPAIVAEEIHHSVNPQVLSDTINNSELMQ